MDYSILLPFAGAAIAVSFAGLGSCIGIGAAGAKSGGVLAEKPETFSKLLILTALPGSQGVYGLIIAIMILSKIGAFGGGALEIDEAVAFKCIAAGCAMGISGLASGWFQGKVVASAVGAVARNEDVFGRAITLSVLAETYAIFGLLVSIFFLI